MTTQTDYTPSEWDLIVGAPALITLAIIHIDQCSPDQADHRLRTTLAALTESVAQGLRGELIEAVIRAIRAGQLPHWPTEYPYDPTNVRHSALESCRRLASLLAQKAPELEADAYCNWLIAIAHQVALASQAQLLPDPELKARIHQQRIVLDQLSAALSILFAADGMCTLTASWRPPLQ